MNDFIGLSSRINDYSGDNRKRKTLCFLEAIHKKIKRVREQMDKDYEKKLRNAYRCMIEHAHGHPIIFLDERKKKTLDEWLDK